MAVDALEVLLGERHAGRAPPLLGERDAPGELDEVGRQIARADRVVGQLGATAHDGPLDAVEADVTAGVDAHA